jgi:hypothetical protein
MTPNIQTWGWISSGMGLHALSLDKTNNFFNIKRVEKVVYSPRTIKLDANIPYISFSFSLIFC